MQYNVIQSAIHHVPAILTAADMQVYMTRVVAVVLTYQMLHICTTVGLVGRSQTQRLTFSTHLDGTFGISVRQLGGMPLKCAHSWKS